MRKPSRAQLEQKVAELEAKIKIDADSLNLKQEEHKNELARIDLEWKQKEQVSDESNKATIQGLEAQVETLGTTVKEKQSQLDRRELKKLASAYKEQEDTYREESSLWLKWLLRVAGALVVSTGISIYLSSDKVWYDKFEYYIIDFIFISAVWFCSFQYSTLVKLTNDYANRKTIAQSFHNILNNLAQDTVIKDKFIEKATDVLCAPSFSSDKEPILSKKLIKDTAEIVKIARG